MPTNPNAPANITFDATKWANPETSPYLFIFLMYSISCELKLAGNVLNNPKGFPSIPKKFSPYILGWSNVSYLTM